MTLASRLAVAAIIVAAVCAATYAHAQARGAARAETPAASTSFALTFGDRDAVAVREYYAAALQKQDPRQVVLDIVVGVAL